MTTRFSDASPAMLRIDPDDDPRTVGPAAAGVRLWAALAVAAIAVAGFGGVVAYGYLAYSDRSALTPAPLIKADDRPLKVRPNDPGGMAVPHQDKVIFGVGGREPDKAPRSVASKETLLPPPERVLPKPAPQPAVQPVAATPPPSDAAARGAAAIAPAAAADPATPANTGPAPFPAPMPPPAAPSQRLTAVEPQQPGAATSAAGIAGPQGERVTAAPAARAGGYRIQVGALRTEAEAQEAWERVRRKHPDVVGGLSASFTRVDFQERGVFYRVHVGPLPDRDAARDACARLAKGGTGCIVVPPS